MKYISILRGINVSGQKKIKMADLRTLYENLGFKEVNSYIQSGNVVFSYPAVKEKSLENKIGTAIQEAYDFEVPIMVLKWKDFDFLLNNNPFLKKKNQDESNLYVTILEKNPNQDLLKALEELSFAPDEFIVDGRYIFVHCPNGYGRTKINNNFFERKLKLRATTRNWKTTKILWEMGK